MPAITETGTVWLTPRGTARLGTGHPWIYRSDIGRARSAAHGAILAVETHRGQRAGAAFYSAHSEIALRLVTVGATPVDEAFLARRLQAAIQRRGELAPGRACRLVFADADFFPGLVADYFGQAAVIETPHPTTDGIKHTIAGWLTRMTPAQAVFEKNTAKVRELEKLPPTEGWLAGSPVPLAWKEGAMAFQIEPAAGQKTGAYLDQAENHLRAGTLARGDTLDLFAYMGGFALQMALRAGSVTAVDSSAQATAKIAALAAANGLTNVRTVTANAFDWLREAERAGNRFDTIVVDPPAFIKNRATIPAGLRGYKELNLRAMRLLRPGGVIMTCSCSHFLTPRDFRELLAAAAADTRRYFHIVAEYGAAPDHPVRLGFPESSYLKCFVLRAVDEK